MARGGIRRLRCDENAGKPANEGVKRTKGEDSCGPVKESGGSSNEQLGSRKGRKSGRKRARAKKGNDSQDRDGSSMITALLPINVNASGPVLTDGGVSKKGDTLSPNNLKVQDCLERSEFCETVAEVELSSSSCMHSPESMEDVKKTVIWSNAAFCSEQQAFRTETTKRGSPACNDNEVPEVDGDDNNMKDASDGYEAVNQGYAQFESEVVNEDTKEKDEKITAMVPIEKEEAGNLEKEEKALIPIEEEEAENVGKAMILIDEEESDHMEKEIEKEIALLTKRLEELRARREERHKVQERAKRALSCPPTPLSTTLQQGDADKVKSRSRGRMVSAKFLQCQTKSPETKVSEKRVSFRKGDTTIRASQTMTSSVNLSRSTEITTAPYQAGTETEWKESSLKITPKIPRNKIIDRLQAGAGLKCLSRRGSSLRNEYRCSLDGNFIEQIRNLSLSPATSNTSDSSKKFDWTKSLRCRASTEKRSQGDEGQKKEKAALTAGKETPEAQLLVDLKESKASKASPAITRKVRTVASRYSVSPSQPSTTRKRSLDGPSQASPSVEAGTVSSHKKRASMDQQQQAVDVAAATSLARKSGLGGAVTPKFGSQSSSRLKPRIPTNKEGITTPPPTRKDGLESERTKLPGLVINRDIECSPRDSGCVKRASQQKKGHFFSTDNWV